MAGAGALLASATGAVAALRRASKPLHPHGEVLPGRIYRRGGAATTGMTGVAWLDEPGEHDAEVRRSRAIGLPRWLPDIHGLAVRVRSLESEADLLFATTGRGGVSRFVLTASRQAQRRPMTTLLPYQTPPGPVLLGLEAISDEEGTLFHRAAGPALLFRALDVLVELLEIEIEVGAVGPAEVIEGAAGRSDCPGPDN